MGDFDKIVKRAKEADKQAIQRRIDIQARIEEAQKHDRENEARGNSYGKHNFLQTKAELESLGEGLKTAAESVADDLFQSIGFAENENELTDPADRALFRLQQGIIRLYESNKKYTNIRNGFEKKSLNETIKAEQEAFVELLSDIAAVDSIFDELMLDDISDTKSFDHIYFAFNNIRKRCADISEGSMYMIQDSYDNGRKVYKINAKNPLFNAALGKQLQINEAIQKHNQKHNVSLPYADNIKAEWLNEPEPLFTHDPCPEDVMQGRIGDCYLVSALSAIAAQNPERIREMIKLRQVEEKDPVNPARTISSTVAVVRLYTAKNEPVDVTVPYSSCYISGTNHENGNSADFTEPLYAGGAVWVKIIEKAIVASGLAAKNPEQAFSSALSGSYNPDYDSISGGHSHQVMQTLLGPEMALLDDGSFDLDKFEMLTPSKAMYEGDDGIEARMEALRADVCAKSQKIISDAEKSVADIRQHVKSSIESNRHFGVAEKHRDENIDEIIDEVIANPQLASEYFDNSTAVSPGNPVNYFTNVSNKLASIERQRNTAKQEIDKYDYSKNGKPINFPAVYSNEEEAIFSRLLAEYEKNQPLTAGSHHLRDDDDDQQYDGEAKGIPFKHAYSITNVFTAPNGVKYVEVRNPHNAGTRQYDRDGNAYFDPDTSKQGYSQLELRDFCKTFEHIYIGHYDPKPAYRLQNERANETRELYGDALAKVCEIIGNADTYKVSPQFNVLRARAKELKEYLRDEKTGLNTLENSVNAFFEAAENYKSHRDAESSSRSFNKVSAANRYLAAEAALAIRDIKTANNLPNAEKKEAFFDDIRRDCMSHKEGESIARKSSIAVVSNLDMAAQAKAAEEINKQISKLTAEAKAALANGLDKRNEQDIITGLSTLVYLEDVRKKASNLSQHTLASKYTPAAVKQGVDRIKAPVTEALADILKEKGDKKFIEDFSKSKDPVKIITDTWEKQLRERHPEAFKEAKPEHVTGYNVQNKAKENEVINMI